MSLSVLSLNIWNDSGPWPERAARVRREAWSSPSGYSASHS